jgi:hypothetical protein
MITGVPGGIATGTSSSAGCNSCVSVASAAAHLDLQIADAARVIDLGPIVNQPPAVVGVATDAALAANVAHRQALGQIDIDYPQEAPDLLRDPSLPHESFLGPQSEGLQ